MRAAYVTSYDATDPDAFNGIGWWIGDCMVRAGLDVDFLGPLGGRHGYVIGSKRRYYERSPRRTYNVERDPRRVRKYSREIAIKLSERPAEVVLSGVSPGSQPVAYLEVDVPIVVWTDATFAAAMTQNRENLVRLAPQSRRGGYRNERAMVARCDLLVFSSDWAARTAREMYDLPEDFVHVIPFGPSLEIEHGRAEVERMVAGRQADVCRLLLVATRWRAKGADVAVEATRELNDRGLRTELDIVGCAPPAGTEPPPYVRLNGFLHKGDPLELARLRRFYREAHLLILPTRAEACPTVISEANAFGVPAAVTNVGGVPTALRDGINGMTFPEEAGGAEFADYVLELMGDPDRYRALARSSFAEYESRLNWSTSGARLRALLEELVERGSGARRRPARRLHRPRALSEALAKAAGFAGLIQGLLERS
jgi:glycosyltransferase involved in cell wall biosynthesis